MAENEQYKLKVCRSADENRNRQLYMSKKAVKRKWLSVCSHIDEHGDKQVYEKSLVQAFNLTEFVMDNWIEETFRANNKKGNLRRINSPRDNASDSGTYLFVEQDVTIDFSRLLGAGYKGKTEILSLLGVTLPPQINKVRANRNKYAHGTDTYKSSTREELDDFATVQLYMDTLGQLLVAMDMLSEDLIRPTYQNMMLQVGHEFGFEDKYSVLQQIKKEKGWRAFKGHNGKTRKDVYIIEIAPRPDLMEVYRGSKENLVKLIGNGIVRTEDVFLQNRACYIVKELVEGESLDSFLKEHQPDNETKKDLLYQAKKIVALLQKNPNVCSEFDRSDFVVDAGGDLWLREYEFGKLKFTPEELIRRFTEYLELEEVPIPVAEEIPQAEPDQSEPKQDQPECMEAGEDLGRRPNNWPKLFYTIGVCSGIIVVLWILSNLIP